MGVPLDKLTSLPRTLRDQAHAQKLAQDAIARQNASESASSSETQHSAAAPTLALEPREPRVRGRRAAQSPLAAKFELLWRAIAPDIALKKEVRVVPSRKFRYDYAIEIGACKYPFSLWRFAVELEGLIYQDGGGRHQQSKGFESDCQKYLLGTLNGDRIFRLSPKLITPDNIERIAAFIRARK